MKPFILVCGVPHSLTSMVAKFLMDNGAYSKETWDNPKYNSLNYSRYEDKDIQNFVNKRKNFQNVNLTDYFISFPNDKVIMAKAPRAAFYINEFRKYTKRKIKVVYVMRNPEQIIISSMEKSKKSFIFYFERIVWMYRFITDCQYEVLPVIAERLQQDAKRLLEYCELPVKQIDTSSIKPIRSRKADYIRYRFANAIWKFLSKMFILYQ